MEDEADAMRVDDVYSLDPIVQQLRRGASITQKAELHVLRREGVAVVEFQPLAQLELVHEPVRALLPRLGQAGRRVVAGQRFDQRVVQGVQEHERHADSGGLAGIEKRESDRDIEGHGQLTVRLGLRRDFSAP